MTTGPGPSLTVETLWNGGAVDPAEIARVQVARIQEGWRVEFEAPFFGDPPPPGPPGSTEGLWEFEVVEFFVVARTSLVDRPVYTEVELSPHGHHLVLRFQGIRERVAVLEPLAVKSRIEGERWHGSIVLAREQLPAPPWNANAFAVHGTGSDRRHLAAALLPGDSPDFHQPAAFPEFPDPRRA